MNTVDNLLAKPFGSLCLQEQLEVKNLGADQPVIKIVQATKERGKETQRKFNLDWYKRKQWLCGSQEKQSLFCFPCLLFGGDSVWTKIGVTDLKHLSQKIKTHESCGTHMGACTQLALFGKIDVAQQLSEGYRLSVIKHNEQVDKNRYILNKLIQCIRFCGAFELALRGHDESDKSTNPGIFRGLVDFVASLDSAMEQHLQNASVFKGTSKTIQNELLQCMLEVCHDHISEDIKNADYIAIQADETTDVTTNCQLVLIYRYAIGYRVVERFWGFIKLESCSAVSIANVIKTELKKHIENTPEKLIGQSYDGAAVMRGETSGVQVRIKQDFPYAHYVHCYAHQLNLIMEQATSQIKEVRIFFASLSAFPAFFSRSPKRTAVLDEVVNKRLPKPVATRWNFQSRTVNVVFENREALIECLTIITESNFDVITIREATGLLNFLNEHSFMFMLTLFHQIMPHVDVLYSILQKRQIDAIQISSAISDFEKCISEVRGEVHTINEMMPEKDNRKRRNKNQEGNRSAVAREVCDIVISHTKERFGFTDHLVASKLLHGDLFKKYVLSFPEKELDCIAKSYPMLNKERLKTELKTVYKQDVFHSAKGAIPLLKLLLENNLAETLSETVKLLQLLVTTPMTTAESERCFSTLKRIKTFLRNSMTDERLNALAMLSIEQKLINDMENFNHKVIEKFVQQKNRRMDFLYK